MFSSSNDKVEVDHVFQCIQVFIWLDDWFRLLISGMKLGTVCMESDSTCKNKTLIVSTSQRQESVSFSLSLSETVFSKARQGP